MRRMHGGSFTRFIVSVLLAFALIISMGMEQSVQVKAEEDVPEGMLPGTKITYTDIESIHFEAEKWQNMNIPYSIPSVTTSYSWELTFANLSKINGRRASFVGAYTNTADIRSGYLYSDHTSIGGTADAPAMMIAIGKKSGGPYYPVGNREKNTVHVSFTSNGSNGTYSMYDSLKIIGSSETPVTGNWTGHYSLDEFSLVACARYEYGKADVALYEFATFDFYGVKIWEGDELKIDITPVIRKYKTAEGVVQEVGGYEHVTDKFVPLAGYAKESIDIFTVTFDGCGASRIGTKELDVPYNSVLPTIEIPQKTGYIFKGYFAEPDGQGRQFYDSEGNGIGNFDIKGHTTIFACWEENIDTRMTTESQINYQDGFFHYYVPGKEHVLMQAQKADTANNFIPTGEKVNGTYLDLTREELISNLEYDCYSLDGGKKWVACNGELTRANISKWFSSPRTILIADNFDATKKKPGENATVLYLGKTKKRATISTLKADYSKYCDDFGATCGQWGLIGKTDEIVYSDYEFMIQDETGCCMAKDYSTSEAGVSITDYQVVADKGEYGSWPEHGGVWVPKCSDNGKTVKAKIACRKAASFDGEYYTPASKDKKLTISSTVKAPKLKVDYKKESIKLKKDMCMYFGAEVPKDEKGNPIVYPLPAPEDILSDGDLRGTLLYKSTTAQAKTGVDLSKYFTTTRNNLIIWQTATQKKPASEAQKLEIAARSVIVQDVEVSVSATGKISLDSAYEAFTGSKWTKSVKIKNATTTALDVRLKATAKAGKDDESTNASSNSGKLVLYYGKLANGKKGCIGAMIYPVGISQEELDEKITLWYAEHVQPEEALQNASE